MHRFNSTNFDTCSVEMPKKGLKQVADWYVRVCVFCMITSTSVGCTKDLYSDWCQLIRGTSFCAISPYYDVYCCWTCSGGVVLQ